jgi:hypothetical protein
MTFLGIMFGFGALVALVAAVSLLFKGRTVQSIVVFILALVVGAGAGFLLA